jgi:RNA ligase
MTKIISYQECVDLCEMDNSPFYETKTVIEGYNVSVFNYRLAQWSDFSKPFGESSDVTAYELRGLTFVFNKDGSLFKRYLLLKKFFNLNQVPETLYDVVKDYNIINVNNKEDGSLATFIMLPNGEIIGKSKIGFDNEQAEGINKIYKTNQKIREFVKDCLEKDIIPIFEYVAPSNRIVLRYKKEELILLKLRNNATGEYIDTKNINHIKKAKREVKTLDKMLKLAETIEEKEGWVVETDVVEYKIKTEWYRRLHGLITDDLYREHVLIKHILNDDIDDVICEIPENDYESLERVNSLVDLIRKEVNDKVKYLKNEFEKFKNMSEKEYAINHLKGNPDGTFILNMIKHEKAKKLSENEILDAFKSYDKYHAYLKSKEVYQLVINDIRDKTKRLELARNWLSKKGFKC